MTTIQQQLIQATQQLTNTDSPRLDAEVLLSHVLEKDRSYFFTWPEKALTDTELQTFQQLVQQRQQGTPIAYLIGYRDFWTLNLKVTPDTLIPRPETELLVETALDKIAHHQACNILDLGTGTGAIALAIASERPDANIIATDISEQTLNVAKDNAHHNHIHNVSFLASNWFEDVPAQPFDLIVSNPPYIPKQDPHLSQGDVRFEPLSALASGEDGLDDIRTLIQQAKDYLTPNGWLMLEHGYDQGKSVPALLKEHHFKAVDCLKDISGNDRISIGLYK
jgi:release factor glutamine methyltransferase